MEYAYLGRTGVRVSEICLGTMTFGNEADEAESVRIMDRAADAGVNFFDTADIYSRGESERITGRWLEGKRDGIVLASKVHFATGEGINEGGSSRLHILRGVEASLKRLRTDRLDILYLHHWDDHAAIEESLGAIDHLVRQGKVLYAAVSNFSAWQTMKAIAAARERGLAPIVAIQPQYSLLKRLAEVEILPMAADAGLGVCPYSPMAAGLLTGKYQRNEAGRISTHPLYIERYKDPVHREVSDKFVAYAIANGHEPGALAVAWVVGHPAVTSAIVGARNLAQFEAALKAVDIRLDEETRAAISDLSVEPPLPTERERTAYRVVMMNPRKP